MRHYILTRSAFGETVDLAENRLRLELLRRVTAPSLAAQTNRNVTWIVLTAPDDPLADERRAILESAGLPLMVGSAAGMILRGHPDKPYGPWAKYVEWGQVTLTTRLDDDDALAPWVLAAIRAAAEKVNARKRVVWNLPDGWRVAGPMAERAHWSIPMFSTLQAPAGDKTTIMAVNHLGARRLGRLRPVTQEPAWLWIRHAFTRSSYLGSWAPKNWRREAKPITPELRAAFPVDWEFVESLKARSDE